MRGIPFKASQGDVIKFFSPLMPRHIELLMGEDGRPSGTAYAFFHSHEDALVAMEKDKEHMGWFVRSQFRFPPHGIAILLSNWLVAILVLVTS